VHAFFFREAWRSFMQHRGLALTAILSLTAALTLCALFVLLTHNADHALRLIGDRREMMVYLRDGLKEDRREELIERIRELYGSATYISKEEAWKEFESQVGDPQLLEAVGENPLPAALRVRLKPELLNLAAMQRAAEQVMEFPEVEDVRYGANWVRRLDELTLGLSRGAIAVGVVVALAIVLVIYNTIRLSVMARRPQVEIMSRLGASNYFIAAPFVIEAIAQATLAAIAALAILFAIQQALVSQVWKVVFITPTHAALFVGRARDRRCAHRPDAPRGAVPGVVPDCGSGGDSLAGAGAAQRRQSRGRAAGRARPSARGPEAPRARGDRAAGPSEPRTGRTPAAAGAHRSRPVAPHRAQPQRHPQAIARAADAQPAARPAARVHPHRP
jgi:cell division transport system permease protein